MIKAGFLFCTVVCIFTAFAQSGRVVDEQNAPLKNAVVELKVAGKRILTNSNGEFNFSETAVGPVRSGRNGGANARTRIQQNRLVLDVIGSEQVVKVDAYTLQGRRIGTVVEQRLNPGNHTVMIVEKGLVQGTTVLRVYVNGCVENLVYTPGGVSGKLRMLEPSIEGFLKSAATSDTLLAFRYGYYTKTQTVTTSASNIVIALRKMPTDSFVPPGMRKLPGGTFTMGSATGQPHEQPHSVYLSPFYIDTTEVTQVDYYNLMKIRPWEEYGRNNAYFGGEGPNYPVWHISWNDAVLYCNARSKRDGLDTVYSYDEISGTAGSGCTLAVVVVHYDRNGYMLPTEAQWEYAARAGTQTDFYWGDSRDTAVVNQYAWWYRNSNLTGHAVALKLPNAFNLYDMAGNMIEFVNDYFGLNYYLVIPAIDPTGPETGDTRVIRGGDFRSLVQVLRTSARIEVRQTSRRGTSSSIGFRVALRVR